MDQNVIVTGGAGYIGLHTVKALKEEGFTPVVIDNLSVGKGDPSLWGILVKGDMGDPALLDEVFETYKPVAVVHMAASAEVGESATNPEKYYRNNVGGTLALLSAMKKHGVSKILVSSTCAVYGQSGQTLINENTARQPANTYGRTKLVVEMILEDYARAYGLSYVGLRYFNACGADPSGLIGENHDPETHLIPRALMACAGKIPAIDLYGDDYPTPDGTCIRDYIHVCDIARAHVLGVGYLLKGGKPVFLNIGTGNGASVRQILDAVEKVTGLPVPLNIRPRREGDSPSLVGDPTLIAEVLGFKTHYNDIAEIIRTAWGYHSRQWGLDSALSGK